MGELSWNKCEDRLQTIHKKVKKGRCLIDFNILASPCAVLVSSCMKGKVTSDLDSCIYSVLIYRHVSSAS